MLASYHKWTDDEAALLRKMYPNYQARKIAAELGLPLAAVEKKVQALGLRKIADRTDRIAKTKPLDEADEIPVDAKRIASGIVYQAEPGRTVHRCGVGR